MNERAEHQGEGGPVQIVRLSRAQCSYILAASFVPADLRGRVAEVVESTPAPRQIVLEISRDQAESLRSAWTDRIAQVGFDKNYEPTEEGVVLEDLVDAFYGGVP